LKSTVLPQKKSVMAMFEATKGKPSWGDDTDDEFDNADQMAGENNSEDDFFNGTGEVTTLQFNENVGKPTGDMPAVATNNVFLSDSEDSESDNESDEEEEEAPAAAPQEQIQEEEKKPALPVQLSKAERRA
ncbi:unnamed protein product, partial [Heterosigma akashiwo]